MENLLLRRDFIYYIVTFNYIRYDYRRTAGMRFHGNKKKSIGKIQRETSILTSILTFGSMGISVLTFVIQLRTLNVYRKMRR